MESLASDANFALTEGVDAVRPLPVAFGLFLSGGLIQT